jgi:hypothetical protein
MPVILEPLTIRTLNELIKYHEKQGRVWGEGQRGTDHRRWAAWLEKLRQAVIAEIEE